MRNKTKWGMPMKRIWTTTSLYAFAHFAVDFGCAYAMFCACRSSPGAFLLYNFFAFAMQMPIGLLADALGQNRLFALVGTAIVAVMQLFGSFGIGGACLLGLGNALFHVGGGLDVMTRSPERAAPLGVFVSPGAFGIYLGTVLGSTTGLNWAVVAVLAAAGACMLLFVSPSHTPSTPVVLPERSAILPGLLLFLVVVLRSYGGMAASFSWKTGLWSVICVFAVVLGKTLGGFLSDRIGLLPAAGWTLGLSAVFFCAADLPVCGAVALLLFNMTMPMTLFALSRKMPGCRGFSFGLLTFALFLGYLPTFFGAPSIHGPGMALVCILSAALLLWGIRKAETP